MYDGDWRKFLKDRGGLISAFFAAGMFVIALAWPAVLAQREIDNNASRNAGYYAENAQNNVAAKCSGLSGQARADCANPIENPAREAQRGEYDLAAQQTMAIWTAVMGGVAVLGVALSGIGVYLVWTTFRETRRTAKIASDNLDAYRRAERGYCEIEISHGMASPTSDIVFYYVQIKNSGRSAVKVLTIRYEPLIDALPLESFNGGTHEEFHVAADVTTNPQPLVRGLKNVKRFPHIGGYVEYRCKFGDLHRSYFCYAVEQSDFAPGPDINIGFRVKECKRERDWPADT